MELVRCDQCVITCDQCVITCGEMELVRYGQCVVELWSACGRELLNVVSIGYCLQRQVIN